MQLKSTLIVAALSACAAADFVIVTARPTPTNLNDLLNVCIFIHPGRPTLNNPTKPRQLPSYIASLGAEVTQALASAAANPSAVSEAAKMNSALRSFAATASYSIPAKVTEIGSFETYTTVPEWYSALPSDVKSYHDKNNQKVESLLLAAAGVTPTASKSGSAAASGDAAKPTQTAGASRIGAAVGVVAAAIAGVAVL
jgi:hypothetical protein